MAADFQEEIPVNVLLVAATEILADHNCRCIRQFVMTAVNRVKSLLFLPAIKRSFAANVLTNAAVKKV